MQRLISSGERRIARASVTRGTHGGAGHFGQPARPHAVHHGGEPGHRPGHCATVEATAGFGAIIVVTGFLGTFAGGWLGDWGLKFSRQAYLWISGWATLLAVPATYLALASGKPEVFYAALIVAELLLFMSTGPINTAIVNLVSPAERACAVALSLFVIHALGDVISPSIIGGVSDMTSLGVAVMIVPFAVAVGGVLWLLAARADAKAVAEPVAAA